MVAVEGLASGRPIVGFRSRGLEQTVRHGQTGFLVEAGDIEALGQAIDVILKDPPMAKRMGTKARESVRGFSWERVVERSIALYDELTGVATPALALRSS